MPVTHASYLIYFDEQVPKICDTIFVTVTWKSISGSILIDDVDDGKPYFFFFKT